MFVCFSRRRPSAFTLVELLVVIAIIGVLVALLLPAVQQAREAARRMTCVNKLKQLGVAMHNYHDSHNTFPMGHSYNTGSSRHCWTELLMPFLDMQSVHDRINFSIQYNSGTNRTVFLNQAFPAFACPSNPYSSSLRPLSGDWDRWNAGESIQGLGYPLCAGSIRPDGSGTPDCTVGGSATRHCITEVSSHMSWQNAASYQPYWRQTPGIANRTPYGARLVDITDGTKSTFMAGERNAENLRWGAAFTENFPIAFTGQRLNSPSRIANSPSSYKANGGFSSHHPGGGNFVMCDGSVVFVSDSIDFPVYTALGDKGDGRLTPGF
ncbi:hypothetical protein Pan216_30520 [Planctomycetes bacterium Pan216]|uniref:DUF1559 domain-containing protein n=1 Tax=Kolteria novifilia TaxID=2527975 RepID=A0A518B5E3_9BACT|nr:hypothetical protein Pan216_30520 [Planctomycetes bacterium Pan216]